MIPKQLKDLKFCRIKKGSKAPFEKDWINKPYSYEKITPLFPMENYGVLCGYKNLAVIDCDKDELSLAVSQLLPQTFSVRTGGGGTHFYYFIPELKKKIILNAGEEHLGEIQSYGTQVVGAGSIHPNGNEYEVIDNVEIKTITLEEMKKVLGQFMKKEESLEIKEKEIKDYESLINEIVKVWKEGDRQELALSISGYLRKEKRLGANKVKEIIKKVCEITEDEEVNMRLRAVIETFKKDEKDIKGFTGLGKVDLKRGEQISEEQIREKFKTIYPKIINVLKEYIDMREDYYPIVGIWILGTYIHKIFMTYPYLYFNAMKGSGKSRTLSLISHLSYKGKLVVNMSEAVLFRTAQDSTICIDEFERTKGKEKANLKELLNASYKKGISVERAKKVIGKKGEDYEIERFDVFCPVAMANISGMDEVLGDRSIKLTLERTQHDTISRKLEIWALDGLIRQILDELVSCSVMFSHGLRYIEDLYIHWNAILNTNYTHNIYNTTIHYYTPFFDKITKTTLNGRHLELFFPLFIIADYCEDLDNVMDIAEKIVSEKREEDVYENRDISLIDFVSRQHDEKEWTSQKMLLQSFKEFLEAEDDKWLNAQWFGIALSRLNLVLDKRRLGRGKEVLLNIEKAKDKIKMFH